MNAGTLALTLLSVTISALGQISLKIGMSSPAVQRAMATSTLNLFSAAASSPAVLGGLMLYGMGALSWLLVLAKVDVNRAYPFVGIAIVLTITIGHFFLREPLSALRMMGVLFVVAGIVLVAQC